MVSTGEEERRQGIYEELNREARLSNSLTILFSQAVAERLGVHSTDIETVDLLHIMGPMTAGRLSEVTGLTTGATTRLIDRMERAGFARRRHDPSDRRRVVVEATMDNAGRVLPLFEPIARRMGELWSTYSTEQLDVMVDFFRKSNLVMSEENTRLRSQASPEAD
jgi:DNA-binding MarR family transcriptional regulator